MKGLKNSVLGLVAGLVALILVTAILAGAYSSNQAESRLADANLQLHELKVQRDKDRWTARRLHATDQRENHDLLEALTAYAAELRKQGIDIPRTAFVPRQSSGSGSTRPKVPSPSPSPTHPGSPAPTGTPTPSPEPLLPDVDACKQVSMLCPFLTTPLDLGLPVKEQ